jgi:hypothetical protein
VEDVHNVPAQRDRRDRSATTDLREALARIAGLGPSKIARFGDDILAVVRRHAAGVATAGEA